MTLFLNFFFPRVQRIQRIAHARLNAEGCDTSSACLLMREKAKATSERMPEAERQRSLRRSLSLSPLSLSLSERKEKQSPPQNFENLSAFLLSMGRVRATQEGSGGADEATAWESETSVRCLVTHGARGSRRVVRTAGVREGVFRLNCDTGMIGRHGRAEQDRMRGQNRAGTGSASVSVHGSSMGVL
jgi:hypothetical protein